MAKKSGIQLTGTTIVIALLIAVVAVLGYSSLMSKAPINLGDIAQDQAQGTTPVLSVSSKFGDDNTGVFRPAVYNSMDTTATTYTQNTIRVYQLIAGTEVYYGDVATASTGVIARGNTTATLTITGYDENNLIYDYVAYVVAADNSRTSGRFTFTAAEDVVKTYAVPNQGNATFKVYDEENRGYLYESTEHTANVSAGTAYVTGKTFTGKSSNSTTGTIIAMGGYYDFTVYFSENGTIGTTNQFEDQRLLVAIDGQDLSDWLAPTLSMSGAVITKLEPGQYNDKIKNDGYDWVYQISKADGTPYHVDSTWQKLRIQQYAKSGVNPADDIKVAFYTSGWFKQTVGDGMKMDSHKDDSSQTAVFTVQDLTLDID